MKRVYETPVVEKISFCYRDQVVVASGEVQNGFNVSYDGGETCTPAIPIDSDN